MKSSGCKIIFRYQKMIPASLLRTSCPKNSIFFNETLIKLKTVMNLLQSKEIFKKFFQTFVFKNSSKFLSDFFPSELKFTNDHREVYFFAKREFLKF